MVRGNVIASLELENEPFFTDGSTIKGVLNLDVRKHDAAVGQVTAILSCEQRSLSVKHATITTTQALPVIPSTLAVGMHSFEFNMAIPESSLASCPPSIHADSKGGSDGVYWILEVVGDPPATLHTSQIVPVYPARTLDIGKMEDEPLSFKKVNRRIPMLTSFEHGEPHKQRPKFFVMLFGPSYRLPKNGEICEVFVRIELKIPEVGVFQSPSKSQFGATISTAVEDSVVLSMCIVKLVSTTTIWETGKSFKSTSDVWSSDLNIQLPRGHVDISDEISDLELPLCAGTTTNGYMDHQYEIRFTFVLRALHFENMTRWVTLSAPITVLPASLRLSDAPPPYTT